MKYKNPIISGYNPDPSICRALDDYYIVNSSFEFFPGVPVYHSRNLVNWELTGYCLTGEEQLQLNECKPSGGIFAPTLRYYDGTFFMTTTNVTGGGNFIVHTRNIKEGWSKPVWVDQGGIDPSLLFDDGGIVYFTSTGMDDEGRQGIFMCRIDPYSGKRLSESQLISYGCGGKHPEGSHLYKWFGRYYLMLAEGGTEYGHMETIQRAQSPYGPYEPCPHNPILTHRDDSMGDIYCTGHGDILKDHNGQWWMVCLGVRTCQEEDNRVLLHNLGRETFLAPVIWTEDGWPVVGDRGRILPEMEGCLPGEPLPVNRNFRDDYSKAGLSPQYNYLRNPVKSNYIVDCANKMLILKGTDITLNDAASPTWLGIRQKGFITITTVKAALLDDNEGIRAGLCAYYNDSYHYELYLTREADACKLCFAKHIHDIFVVTASVLLPGADEVILRMCTDRTYYRFSYSADGERFTELGTGLTAGLCTEGTKTMTFTGTYIGLFAEKGDAGFQEFDVKVVD